MSDIIEKIHLYTSVVIGYIIYLIGYLDNFLKLLIMFMITDFITGLIKAKIEKKITSEKMFIGGYRKILIFVVIMIANLIDITFNDLFLRQTVIIYYIIQEGFSIFENIDTYVSLPPQLTKYFIDLKEENQKEGEN